MKYFIVFFKCTNSLGSMYGNTGFIRDKALPSQHEMRDYIAKECEAKIGQVNITNVTKVDKDDYESFFSE